MKLILAALVVVACRMLGAVGATEKKNVILRLDAAIGLVAHLIRRVEGSNMQLARAINEYESDVLLDIGFYDGFDGGRISAAKAWKSGVLRLDLPEDAERVLTGVSDGLGLVNRGKQLKELRNAYDALLSIKSRMESEYNKKARYYGALGALFGLLAVIILI